MVRKILSKEEVENYAVANSTQECHDTIMDILRWWVKFASKMDLVYYAYSGTLLGVIRHGRIIPWDDDADLCIPSTSMNRLFESIGELPHNIELKISPRRACHRLSMPSRRGFVDLFETVDRGNIIEYKRSEALSMFPNDWAYANEIFPLQISNFGDIELAVPRLADACLTRLYGNWMHTYIVFDEHHPVLTPCIM